MSAPTTGMAMKDPSPRGSMATPACSAGYPKSVCNSSGNILIQARALGAAPGDLDGMRALVRATQPLRRFEPAGSLRRWEAAERALS